MRLYGIQDFHYKDDGTQYSFYDCIEADWVDQHNGQIKYDRENWPPQWFLLTKPLSKKAKLEEILFAGSTWYEIVIEYVDTEEASDASIHTEQNFIRSDIQRDGWIKIVSKNQTDKVGYNY